MRNVNKAAPCTRVTCGVSFDQHQLEISSISTPVGSARKRNMDAAAGARVFFACALNTEQEIKSAAAM